VRSSGNNSVSAN